MVETHGSILCLEEELTELCNHFLSLITCPSTKDCTKEFYNNGQHCRSHRLGLACLCKDDTVQASQIMAGEKMMSAHAFLVFLGHLIF